MFHPQNPLGLNGIGFIEFVSPSPESLHQLFLALGFSLTKTHGRKAIDLYSQGDICFLLNRQPEGHGAGFRKLHGPGVSAMGWRVRDSRIAAAVAASRFPGGVVEGDYTAGEAAVPAVRGIGGSLIYLPDEMITPGDLGFIDHPDPVMVEPAGFTGIDHLTNNVYAGDLGAWSDFYKDIFGFTEVRSFSIRGESTGLKSWALRSPCGSFCIPINEGTEEKSQINEYLKDYNGPGVQHIALTTPDIVGSIRCLHGNGIGTLDIDSEYYETVFDRVPGVTEDRSRLQKAGILVDGDEEGYLLQIFTRNVIGPIFFEVIQRKNHHSFGEGNFGALFRSIERDQEQRGVL